MDIVILDKKNKKQT